MTRKSIIVKVEKMLNNNPQIDTVFKPIIEEFFVRLSEQFNFSEQELDERINKYNELKSMSFYKGEEIKKGFIVNKYAGCFTFSVNYSDTDRRIKISNKRINLDVDYLKYVLLGNKVEIEDFIESVFHEQGHFIQFISQDMYHNNGLNKTYFIKAFDHISLRNQGKITNEFAEVINARILSKGNLNQKNYNGYQNVQSIARTIFSSLGISDKKLGELQMKGTGRQAYEEYIEQKVGKDYRESLLAMENALDTIYAINGEMLNTNLFTSRELKRNMAMQFETINTLSNEMIKRRIAALGETPNVADSAKIIIDKRIRDKNLSKALKQFKFELPIGFNINIESNIIESILAKNIDENQLQKEIEKLQAQENAQKSIAIKYDNNELINKIMLIAQSYDISKFPLKDRIELTICKNIGNLRRIFMKPRVKLLPEKTFTTIQEQRKNFVSRINESHVAKPNDINLDKPNSIENGKEKDENIR